MSDDGEYMNIGEAAAALGVTRKTVYTMVKRGKLQAIPNPVDTREKLIAASDVQQLAKFARPAKKAAA